MINSSPKYSPQLRVANCLNRRGTKNKSIKGIVGTYCPYHELVSVLKKFKNKK